ncbi:MAG: hypothetical protein RLP15_06535 [Cryomorphaceae bacterium]
MKRTVIFVLLEQLPGTPIRWFSITHGLNGRVGMEGQTTQPLRKGYGSPAE